MIYKKLYLSEEMKNAGPYARLKFAMDYWCALWFWPIEKAELLPTRSEFLADMGFILEGTIDTFAAVSKEIKMGQLSMFPSEAEQLVMDMTEQYSGMGIVDIPKLCQQQPRLALVRQIAEQNHFMHWELEFADLFAERGGFDLVIGNPPWVKIEWKAKDIASESIPLIAIRKDGESKFLDAFLENNKPAVLAEYVLLSGQLSYMSAAANYMELSQQQGNIYKCFVIGALTVINSHGVYGLVHPEGLYDNPYGENLRKKLYKHLRYHFEFINERYLFHDVAHTKRFSVNIASATPSNSFITITNLFDPKTIDDCFSDSCSNKLMGLKDDKNDWNLYGHPERAVIVDKQVLETFGAVFDGMPSLGARMPEVHAQVCVTLFEKMLQNKTTIGDLPGFFCSQLMNETAAIKNKWIETAVGYPDQMSDFVYSGPNIWLANPFFKSAKYPCIEKSDYNLVDIGTHLTTDYIPRSKYKTTKKCFDSLPEFDTGVRYDYPYKIFARRRLNLSMERTLISTIVPQHTVQIHAVLGIYVSDYSALVSVAACLNTVIYDFYIKTYGKEDLYDNTISKLPIPFEKNMTPAMARVLALNAISSEFSTLWSEVWTPDFLDVSWTKSDVRLDSDLFKTSSKWSSAYVATNDYARRQLFVELDAYIAMLLGLSLNDLCSIYQLQFPVLQQYEHDTWYDTSGQIVFSNNKSLTNIGFSRPEFENPNVVTPIHRSDAPWDGIMKHAPAGYVFARTITDDTMPGGPVERTIEYHAPFDRCDREQDYETAWKFFEEKYGGQA